jgi:NAD+ diphosphatase
MRDWKYCPRCRASLNWKGEADNPYLHCDECGFQKYNNPLPSTIGVIYANDSFLFTRRAIEPQAGKWDAVGGFLAPSERAEECLVREAREEIGCEVRIVRLLGTYASTYGATGLQTIGIAFLCALLNGNKVALSDENDKFAWFPRQSLPELAFEDVQQAVAEALLHV